MGKPVPQFKIKKMFIPAGISWFQFNNRNTRTMCEICCSMLKSFWYLYRSFWTEFAHWSGLSIVHFEQVNWLGTYQWINCTLDCDIILWCCVSCCMCSTRVDVTSTDINKLTCQANYSQPTITCSKLITETLEQGVKYV